MEEVIIEKFPDLKNEMGTQIQEIQRIPTRVISNTTNYTKTYWNQETETASDGNKTKTKPHIHRAAGFSSEVYKQEKNKETYTKY